MTVVAVAVATAVEGVKAVPPRVRCHSIPQEVSVSPRFHGKSRDGPLKWAAIASNGEETKNGGDDDEES